MTAETPGKTPSKPASKPTTVHKHYHLWPDSDCGCFMLIGFIFLLITIESLASMDKLPW